MIIISAHCWIVHRVYRRHNAAPRQWLLLAFWELNPLSEFGVGSAMGILYLSVRMAQTILTGSLWYRLSILVVICCRGSLMTTVYSFSPQPLAKCIIRPVTPHRHFE